MEPRSSEGTERYSLGSKNLGQEAGGNSGGTPGMPIFLEPECPEVPRVAPETFEKQAQNQKHYILKSDLDKYIWVHPELSSLQ